MRKLTAAALVLALLSVSFLPTTGHEVTKVESLKDDVFVPILAPALTPVPVAVIVDTFNKRSIYSRPVISLPANPPKQKIIAVKPPIVSTNGFRYDPNVSWYGPGFYGKRTACGLAYTKTILGVANKTLPCGTKVTFMWKGKSVTVPVIDRGPYVAGRQWDLSGGLCTFLHHCFTGPIYYRIH